MDSVAGVPDELYQAGDLCIDAGRRLVTRDGLEVPLPNLSFDLLLALARAHPRMLSTEELLDSVWAPTVVNPETVGQRVKLVRQALGDDPHMPRYVVGVRGRGFRMDVPVSRRERDRQIRPAHASPSEPLASRVPTLPEARVHARVGKGSHQRGVMWAIGLVGVILATGLLWYTAHFRLKDGAAVQPATSVEVVPGRKPRVAILPFENLSPDPANAFFADGLHEEIVSTLAERAPGIEVVSRTTMMSYRAPRPLAVVARELRASHLIEGSVRREGNKIRLTLQLIDARTDGHIWSANYDRTLADTLTLESQVAEEVAAQLSARLARPARPAGELIKDTEAFDLYLKAVLALRTFNPSDADTFNRIEKLLTSVIARQPTFALAYAQRARARTLRFVASYETSAAFVSSIRSDLDIARRLAPDDPIVLAALGYFLMCEDDTTGALKAYEAAEAAGLAEGAEWLIPKAHLLLRRGRIEELNATVQRILTLDPGGWLAINFASYHLFRAREPADALRALENGRVPFPALYELWRGSILIDFAGRTEELRDALERYAPTDNPRLGEHLPFYFELLRFEHRYAELRALIDRVPVSSDTYYNGVDFGPIGQTPTALFRGWADLLLKDRAGAAKDGHAVLQFVGRQSRTRWNSAYLEFLAAAGHTFAGECDSARVAGSRALSLVSRADNAVIWATMTLHVAHVDAWCGGQEEAVSLLRQVSTSRPGIGPAAISRDPLFTIPLGQFPAYRELKDQLESAIRLTSLEMKRASPAVAERPTVHPSDIPGRVGEAPNFSAPKPSDEKILENQ